MVLLSLAVAALWMTYSAEMTRWCTAFGRNTHCCMSAGWEKPSEKCFGRSSVAHAFLLFIILFDVVPIVEVKLKV
jgi:hypothetical protein